MKLSVILPVLNEEKCIEFSLRQLQGLRQRGHEIIVVDGGSKDRTGELARHLADKYLICDPGRAKQMNLGAKNASGDVFLFLHADTVVPWDIDSFLNKNVVGDLSWGRFDIRLSGNKIIYRVIEKLINFRSRISGIATGDQGIFLTSKLFKRISGYPEIPLMEDIAICHQLIKHAKPICIRQTILTSSRRWDKNGVLRTILLMWKLRFQFALGVNPEKLAKSYD